MMFMLHRSMHVGKGRSGLVERPLHVINASWVIGSHRAWKWVEACEIAEKMVGEIDGLTVLFQYMT